MVQISEADALHKADLFVQESWSGDRPYALEFESIREVEGMYQVRYTKLFPEPTKENPPYRLVVVDPVGEVSWGIP